MARFDVVVTLAAVAAGAAGAAGSDALAASTAAASSAAIEVLVKTATGSPRDFTTDERHQAVRTLAAQAGAGDEASARALVGLLGSAVDAVVLSSLERVRAPVITSALRASLDRTRLDDEDKAGRISQLCALLGNTGDAAVIPSITRVVDDGPSKELRVACLRSLARLAPSFGPSPSGTGTPDVEASTLAATKALVGYVDHPALGAAAREVLLRMRAAALPLRPLLKHKDPAVVAFATRALLSAAGTGDTAVDDDLAASLEQQLRDANDDAARGRALRALGRALCGDGHDSEPCADARKGSHLVDVAAPFLTHDLLAVDAITALARVRDPRLVLPLSTSLSHKESQVREKSAVLLGRIGDMRAKPALLKRLDATRLESNWTELDALVRAVVALGVVEADAPFFAGFLGRDDIASTSFAGNHKELWVALARLPPSSSKVFVPLLRNPRRETRKSIAELLGQLGHADAAVPLLDLVEKKDEVADDAARALSGCGDAKALPRMQALLEAKLKKEPWSGGGELASSFVRLDRADGLERTLSIIGRHGPLGIELLRALLQETHPSDARAFAHALAQRIDDASDAHTYHWLGVEGWSHIDTRQSLDTLCALTQHPESMVRQRAAIVLQRFPEQKAVACMVDGLARAPAHDQPEIGQALEAATGQSFGTDVKAWRTFVDGGLGLRASSGGGGEAALIAGLDHESPAVRSLAAGRLGSEKKGLPSLLSRLPREDDEAARTAVLAAIAAIVDVKNDDSAKAALIAELERQRAGWPEKVLLARSLDRLGDGRGTLAVLKLLDDPAQQQRAMLALSEVTGEPPTASVGFWRAWWKTHGERYRVADP